MTFVIICFSCRWKSSDVFKKAISFSLAFEVRYVYMYKEIPKANLDEYVTKLIPSKFLNFLCPFL